MPLGSNKKSSIKILDDEKLEIIMLSQGNTLNGILLQEYYRNQKNTWESPLTEEEINLSYEIENEYRKLGVVFGLNSGAGTPSRTLTFEQVPSVYHVTFGSDAHSQINDGDPEEGVLSYSYDYSVSNNLQSEEESEETIYSNQEEETDPDIFLPSFFDPTNDQLLIGITGSIESLCGAISGGFAGDTQINNSINPQNLDWLSINLEPDGYFATLIRGFIGDPETQDRAIDVGDPSRTNDPGTTGFYDPITDSYQKFSNYNYFRLSDTELGLRNASIQQIKTYNKWIQDGAVGGNFTINGNGISSDQISAYYEIGVNTQIVQPGASANVALSHIPTYYNMYQALGQSYNVIVDSCRNYIKNYLIFNKPPKMMVWGKVIGGIRPFSGAGWWNNPPLINANNEIIFGVDSLNKNTASGRLYGEGSTGFIPYIWNKTDNSITAGSGNNYQWSSGGDYPLGSYENRSKSMVFEGASNCAAVFSRCRDMDCYAYQFYASVPNYDLRETGTYENWDFVNFTGDSVGSGDLRYYVGDASFDSSATGATLIPVGVDSWAPKDAVEKALYKSLRLNWLAFYKYFGKKAAIGIEPHLDLFLPFNTHLGFATDHEDFEKLYMKSFYDPITAEEAELHGFDEGEILEPKYFVYWSASYFYLERAFGTNSENSLIGDARKKYINGYFRKNMERRFPPEPGMTQDNEMHWRVGTSWHKYLCKKLDEFGLERTRTIRNYADSKRFEKNNITKTQMILLNQGRSIQFPSLAFDIAYGTTHSTDINLLNSYSDMEVEYGMNTGLGDVDLGDPDESLTSISISNFVPLVSSFLSQTDSSGYTFDWDWISVNIESGASVHAVLFGGSGSTVTIPLNYSNFNRSGTISDATQRILNTIEGYYPGLTPGEITYGQFHDSCVRANNDVAYWIKENAPSVKVMNWWKASVSPIPLIGAGFWNNPGEEPLDENGTPPNGVDSLYKQAQIQSRTASGATTYGLFAGETGTEVRSVNPPAWDTDMSNYPVGSYKARMYSIPFEMAENSRGLGDGFDLIAHQSYHPIYPEERPLSSIQNNEYSYIQADDLTLGWINNGSIYVRRNDALESAYIVNRNNWIANWKVFGLKATVGTELVWDYPGFTANRFSGLATDHEDYKATFIDAILDPITSEEVSLYELPSFTEGKILVPKYWTFWNTSWFTLTRIMDEGLGNFTNVVARDRFRSNIEWRFYGNESPEVDWTSGSDWHAYICKQMDLFGLERCRITKESLDNARKSPLAIQTFQE